MDINKREEIAKKLNERGLEFSESSIRDDEGYLGKLTIDGDMRVRIYDDYFTSRGMFEQDRFTNDLIYAIQDEFLNQISDGENIILFDPEDYAEKLYPYFGIQRFNHFGKGNLVLFTEPQTGTIIRARKDSQFSVGYTSNTWSERAFKKVEARDISAELLR